MSVIETEYGRFLQYLREQNAGEDICRLANLVCTNIRDLAGYSSGRARNG
jgi:hypothetical protein